MQTPEDILTYWLDEVGPERWYTADPDLDAALLDKFQSTWFAARRGACGLWLTSPPGVLAYVILTDQLSRSMFRDTAEAFAADGNARAAAKIAIDREWDLKITEPARHFFYMPLMHAENLPEQERAVRLINDRLPETGAATLKHAKVHREIIRTFGRFPYRNAAQDRRSTAAEEAFLREGGYGPFFRRYQAQRTKAS